MTKTRSVIIYSYTYFIGKQVISYKSGRQIYLYIYTLLRKTIWSGHVQGHYHPRDPHGDLNSHLTSMVSGQWSQVSSTELLSVADYLSIDIYSFLGLSGERKKKRRTLTHIWIVKIAQSLLYDIITCGGIKMLQIIYVPLQIKTQVGM